MTNAIAYKTIGYADTFHGVKCLIPEVFIPSLQLAVTYDMWGDQLYINKCKAPDISDVSIPIQLSQLTLDTIRTHHNLQLLLSCKEDLCKDLLIYLKTE